MLLGGLEPNSTRCGFAKGLRDRRAGVLRWRGFATATGLSPAGDFRSGRFFCNAMFGWLA